MRILAVVLLILLFTMFTTPVFAQNVGEDWSLRFDLSNVFRDIDNMATVVITSIRTLVAIATVILIAWVGLVLWQAKDSYALEKVKIQLIFIFVGLFLMFSTESIARYIFKLFGW